MTESPNDPLERAVTVGAIAALRKRAEAQRQKAAEGSAPAGEKFPGVIIQSPEAATAMKIAADFDGIADELEAGGRQ
jgi:hypothetical protein